MPKNSTLSEANGPLSVGNVVSASLRIYRDRFKLYYGLAFTAYAWILIPVYGWAKFSAASGLISRLAFSEVSERPETVRDAQPSVQPRMWTFLVAGFLVTLIFIAVWILGLVAFSIFIAALASIIKQQQNVGTMIVGFLLGAVAFVAFLFGLIWFFSRLSLVELPLAIEENTVTASAAISRSWELSKGFVTRLQLIFFVASLISLPISLVVQVMTTIAQALLAAVLPAKSPIFSLVSALVSLVFFCASGALLLPFWQALKAVIYYDLRNRKEGFDLQLRDRNF